MGLFCTLWGNHLAQGNDSIHYTLSPVIIIESRENFFIEDRRTEVIDSNVLNRYQYTDLGQALSLMTCNHALSYGSDGSSSSISLRGTSGSHTLINWNGFPINSLTLGSTDLSMVNVGMADKIFVNYGSSGSLHGNYALGGSVDIINRPDWKKNHEFTVRSELGSFDSQRYRGEVHLGNQKVHTTTLFSFLNAKNNFPYRDRTELGTPREKLQHNEVENFLFNHFTDIKISERNKLGMGAWYQVKNKNIPAPMSFGTPNSNQFQKDSTLKIYVKWNRVFTRSSLEVKSAYLYDYLRYTDKDSPDDMTYKIFSEIRSKQLFHDVNYRYYLNSHWTFDFGGIISYQNANVKAYTEQVEELNAALISAAKFTHDRWVSNISFRQAWNSKTSIPFQYSLGTKYFLMKESLALRGNISSKFRLPSFNDKYWFPGGNTELKPEYARSAELGLENQVNVHGIYIKSHASAYYANVDNWIEWKPVGVTWGAFNSKKVQTRGMEMGMDLKPMQKRTWNWQANIRYTFSLSVNKDKADKKYNQMLAYHPKHIVNTNLSFSYKQLRWGYDVLFRSQSLTHGGEQMKAFTVSNLYVQKDMINKRFSTSVFIRIQNLFNESYEIIYAYAMPGRAFYYGLQFTIK